MSGPDAPPTVGNCLPLKNIPLGMAIHNIEMQPGRGGALVPLGRRRARRLAAREADWAQITLPSGEIRRVPAACRATIGAIGNADHMNVVIGKAGRKRWMGRRPHVRGTAMNPIDHPHGGGEGRTKGGRHPVSPTGKPAKGGGTRKRRKPSNTAIVRRRRSRRYGQLKIQVTQTNCSHMTSTASLKHREPDTHGTIAQKRPVRRSQAVPEGRADGRSAARRSRSRPGPGPARSCRSSSATRSWFTTARCT